MYERFTDRARKVMALANQEAQRLGHEYIGTEHILLGMIDEGLGVGASVLKNRGVDFNAVRLEVDRLAPHVQAHMSVGRLPAAPQARKAIEHAIVEARGLNCHHVGTEHLLLGLLNVQGDVGSVVLNNFGLTLQTARQEVLRLLESGSRKKAHPSKVLILEAIELLQEACNSAEAENDQNRSARLMEVITSLSALLHDTQES